MVYKFDPRVVKHNTVDQFADVKYVNYILPDGEIFECREHNFTDAMSFLLFYLSLLDDNYEKKNELLDATTNNKLLTVIKKRLKSMSHDEIHALRVYIDSSEDMLCDVLVSFFNCHLVTRLDREILTGEIDYRCFYDYLLNDFKITNAGRLVYDSEKKTFNYFIPKDRNGYLYDEIKRIKNDTKSDEIELFYKGK